jgi:Zn-dependent peptidase ImmA (M78 family)
MKRIEISITGPTSAGKSIVMAAIAKSLRQLNANVLAEDLEQEQKLNTPGDPQDWELESFRSDTYIVVKEANIPPNALAKKARDTAWKILKGLPGIEPPIDIESIAKSWGLVVREEDLESSVSGMLVFSNSGGTLCVNKSHGRASQRFATAHGLGHYLLHRGVSKVFFEDGDILLRDSESGADKLRELEANAFALEILMPNVPAEIAKSEGRIAALANTFGVSLPVMTTRLNQLGLIL